MIADRTEATLFHLTGMDKVNVAATGAAGVTGSFGAGSSGSPATHVGELPIPDPFVDTEPITLSGMVDDDGAALPPTFRGRVLTENPTDIMLDGPRTGSSPR